MLAGKVITRSETHFAEDKARINVSSTNLECGILSITGTQGRLETRLCEQLLCLLQTYILINFGQTTVTDTFSHG